jgi:hypothetical protein
LNDVSSVSVSCHCQVVPGAIALHAPLPAVPAAPVAAPDMPPLLASAPAAPPLPAPPPGAPALASPTPPVRDADPPFGAPPLGFDVLPPALLPAALVSPVPPLGFDAAVEPVLEQATTARATGNSHSARSARRIARFGLSKRSTLIT